MYTPERACKRDLLLTSSSAIFLSESQRSAAEKLVLPGNIVDAADSIVVPGMIDMHVHATGGGGEAGNYIQQNLRPLYCSFAWYASGCEHALLQLT